MLEVRWHHFPWPRSILNIFNMQILIFTQFITFCKYNWFNPFIKPQFKFIPFTFPCTYFMNSNLISKIYFNTNFLLKCSIEFLVILRIVKSGLKGHFTSVGYLFYFGPYCLHFNNPSLHFDIQNLYFG